MARRGSHEREIEPWFIRNGLPYFVPDERARARAALQPRKTVPVMGLAALAAVASAVALTWVTGQASFAPATLSLFAVLAAGFYAITALRARPILGWALRRTRSSLRQLLPMVTRALPLLLLFVTFLFINAEVWQLSSTLDGSVLWLTLLLFGGITVLFLLVRLPEEVDRVDDEVDDAFVVRACAGTPLEAASREVAADPSIAPQDHAQVVGFERWNLILVLLVIQTAQVVLLSVTVFVFFMLFGSLVMEPKTQMSWTGLDSIAQAPFLSHVSLPLIKVSLFLASFSGFYFTVSAVTDDTYRRQFFSAVEAQLERAVGMRAVYVALRRTS
jgi:hypothetical protein